MYQLFPVNEPLSYIVGYFWGKFKMFPSITLSVHCSHITGDTVNVPSISWTRETVKKLAWNILNVFTVLRLVYSGYIGHVHAVYLQCTSLVHYPLPPVCR